MIRKVTILSRKRMGMAPRIRKTRKRSITVSSFVHYQGSGGSEPPPEFQVRISC
jgi:hypothetical protein